MSLPAPTCPPPLSLALNLIGDQRSISAAIRLTGCKHVAGADGHAAQGRGERSHALTRSPLEEGRQLGRKYLLMQFELRVLYLKFSEFPYIFMKST